MEIKLTQVSKKDPMWHRIYRDRFGHFECHPLIQTKSYKIIDTYVSLKEDIFELDSLRCLI